MNPTKHFFFLFSFSLFIIAIIFKPSRAQPLVFLFPLPDHLPRNVGLEISDKIY